MCVVRSFHPSPVPSPRVCVCVRVCVLRDTYVVACVCGGGGESSRRRMCVVWQKIAFVCDTRVHCVQCVCGAVFVVPSHFQIFATYVRRLDYVHTLL